MKASKFSQFMAAGAALAGLIAPLQVHADVEILISGGNASSSVLFDGATNLFGGAFTSTAG